jgi:hypothetical protein
MQATAGSGASQNTNRWIKRSHSGCCFNWHWWLAARWANFKVSALLINEGGCANLAGNSAKHLNLKGLKESGYKKSIFGFCCQYMVHARSTAQNSSSCTAGVFHAPFNDESATFNHI